MTHREREFGANMHSTFHHNSSSQVAQGGAGHGAVMTSSAGSSFPPSIQEGFAPTAQAISSCSSSNNPLAALEEDLSSHDNGMSCMGVPSSGTEQQQEAAAATSHDQALSSLAASSETMADALRGFQESIFLMSQSQRRPQPSLSITQGAGMHSSNQCLTGLVKPFFHNEIGQQIGPPKTHLPINIPKRILQHTAAAPPAVASASSAPQALPSQAMTQVAPAQQPSSMAADVKTTKKATGGTKKKKKGGWRKPSDKPKRPLSAYNIFFQHEREKIVSAAESPNGEASIPSIAMETRGVPVAALTKAVYTGVNDQLQSQMRGSSLSSFAEPSTIPHQRALVATSSPSAVQTIRTLQQIIVRSRGQTKGTADKAKSSRSHTKTHGKISFVDLAKTVAKKWKELDPASKAVYKAFADMERNLYKENVKAWERKKKAEANAELRASSADKEAAVVADAPKQAAAAASNKKPPLGDEQADRMRRILENASRHGSIHNTNVSSSSSDDGSLKDDGDIFPDFAIPQDAARRPVPATASDRTAMAGTSLTVAQLGTGPGPSMSQIASYVYEMHEQYNKSSAAGHQNQVPTGSNLVSRLDRIVRKSRPPKAHTPRRQEVPRHSTSVCNEAIPNLASQHTKSSIGSTSLASMLDDMFGTDTDIQAQGGSICQIKDAIAKTTIQHRHNHSMEFGDDDMLFDFSSDHSPAAAAAAELNILSPSIQASQHHIEPAPNVTDDAASSIAAMNNPMFDPLHMHAEGVSQASNNIGATQGAADPHGLDEFLRWAFENGTDEGNGG